MGLQTSWKGHSGEDSGRYGGGRSSSTWLWRYSDLLILRRVEDGDAWMVQVVELSQECSSEGSKEASLPFHIFEGKAHQGLDALQLMGPSKEFTKLISCTPLKASNTK